MNDFAQPKYVAHVFISYNSVNLEAAERLCAVLERRGFGCWMAQRNIVPGASWPESIVSAIAESWLMIPVISRDAFQSKHMAREIERADSSNLAILPVRIDTAPLEGELQYFLGNRQWLDLTQGTLEEHEELLVRAVRTLEVESGGQTTRAEGPAPVPRVADLTSIGRPGAAEKCVRAVQDETGRVVQTFMAVLSRRQHAIDGFDLAQPQTLFFALRFLFYMGLISTLLHLPALAAQGISLSSPSHALSFLTDEILEKLALCLALHVAMRSVGGKAELRESVCAVCFLCAFQPLIAVSLIPGHLLTGTLLSQTADGFDLLKGASAVGAQATAWQMTTLGISFAISGVLWVVFFVALFKASRTLHRLGWLRAATALVMGTAAWLVIQAVLLYPFEANMYKGFTRHA